jgi:hypothetical protein
MGLLQLAATALALGNIAVASPLAPRAATVKTCDGDLCFQEFQSTDKTAFAFAIPDTATAGSFDILMKITAPKTVGWAGVAFGGTMANDPLAVAWTNANGGIVSPRKATARTYPAVSTDTTWTVLSGSGSNATHWYVTALGKGASSWGTTKLDPAAAATFAYAQSNTAPTDPTKVDSRFGIHNAHKQFSVDLASAKIANFAATIQKLSKSA